MDPPHSLVMNRERVFIVAEQVLKAASNIPRKNLMSFGTCLGKFTKSGKFHLQVSALEYLAQFAEHRVWLKPQGEGSFLYGNHVLKRYVGKVTENAPAKAGVVVMSPTDVPLGFGVLNKSTVDLRPAGTDAIAVFNVSDVGLYIRKEREIFGGGSADKERQAADDH